jgi:preprotein translocase subunit SecE
VARDRKRAKQRRARRGAPAAGRDHGDALARPAEGSVPPQGSGGSPSARPAGEGSPEQERPGTGGAVQRADLPGALEHTGEVDEFDAALIRGAGGIAAAPDAVEEAELESEAELEAGEDLLQDGGAAGAGNGGPPGEAALARPSGAPLRGGNRAIGFLRASWAELQRVQWPDRRHVFQGTAVVLGFVVVAGVYLGVADVVAKEIVNFIL